jgi:hypothetical protein
MREMVQKYVNTSLFNFQDLKLSTKDIIAILKDTMNTTLGPLLIPDPHATWVPSNTLERHSIGLRVVDNINNLVTNFNMAKLVGSPTSDSTFTYQKGAENTSLVDLLLTKGVVDTHFLHKVFHSFPKVVLSEGTSDALPSPGVNPLKGSPKCSCGKLGFGRRSRLPTLERGRGSSWEPRD